MESNNTANTVPQPPPSTGKLITILSIDGGGIRGLIPATIVAYLEAKLQVTTYAVLVHKFRSKQQ